MSELVNYIKNINISAVDSVNDVEISTEKGYWLFSYSKEKNKISLEWKLSLPKNRSVIIIEKNFKGSEIKKVVEFIQQKISECEKCGCPNLSNPCKNCSELSIFELKQLFQDICCICRENFNKKTTASDILFFKCCEDKQIVHKKCFYTLKSEEIECGCHAEDFESCDFNIFKKCLFHPNEMIGINIDRNGFQKISSIKHHEIIVSDM